MIIFRYCDRLGNTKDDKGCGHFGYVSYKRAAFLPTLFGNDRYEKCPPLLHVTLGVRSEERNV